MMKEKYSMTEKITTLLETLIKNPVKIGEMKKRLFVDVQQLDAAFPVAEINNLPVKAAYFQFQKWLVKAIKQDPVPRNIHALYFGLFEGKADTFELYLSGSPQWDADDPDWPSWNEYDPVFQYSEMEIFHTLYNIHQKNEVVGNYLITAVPLLLLINYVDSNSYKLLPRKGFLGSGKKKVYIALGFDENFVFNLFKITKGGHERLSR